MGLSFGCCQREPHPILKNPFEAPLSSQSQLPAIMNLAREKMKARVAGSLTPTWENWIESPRPGLDLPSQAVAGIWGLNQQIE